MILGIEGTAHTFGVGIADEKMNVLADARSVYRPVKGGIHPAEAAGHHEKEKENTLENALSQSKLSVDDVDAIAFSAGPGLPPCLRVTMGFAKSLAAEFHKPLIPVNHAVAHLEIARTSTKAEDPVFVYVSGGNTQIIARSGSCYRIFGETLDIAIGNAIDEFVRKLGYGFPGGPVLEEKASEGRNYIELPYVVKGMDLSFSGIVTAAIDRWKKGCNGKDEEGRSTLLNDICFSFQETVYAMLTEVTERAIAHTGKPDAVITGGVAASSRLREMMNTMCKERGARFFACPKEYSGDNGVNIAVTGVKMHSAGCKIDAGEADFYPRWRVDEAKIKWK